VTVAAGSAMGEIDVSEELAYLLETGEIAPD
jgi:hypothetical protein